MIRCVRMWTGDDGNSLFEEGSIDLAEGARGDFVGERVPVAELSFRETGSGGSWAWHRAYVVYEDGADPHLQPATAGEQA
jgi:hypothetical protein